MTTRQEIEEIVRSELSRQTKCRPEYPHEGKLRYTRGNPGVYICECGQRYVKDGRGGLMAEPVPVVRERQPI